MYHCTYDKSNRKCCDAKYNFLKIRNLKFDSNDHKTVRDVESMFSVQTLMFEIEKKGLISKSFLLESLSIFAEMP